MPLGHKDSRSVTGFRSPDDRPEIMGIFHAVKNNNERSLPLEQYFEVCIRQRGRNGNDALMPAAFCHPIQHGSFFFSNRNVALAGEIENRLQFDRMPFARNVNAFDRQPLGSQSFIHGMDAANAIRHSRNTSATASAAIASSAPTIPRCSIVLAFTWTLLAGMPRTSAI